MADMNVGVLHHHEEQLCQHTRIPKIPQFRFQHEIGRFAAAPTILKFSPDGQYLASVRGNNVMLWNVHERTLEKSIDDFNMYDRYRTSCDITSLAWSLDSTMILTGSSDHGLSLWDRGRRDRLMQLMQGHTDYVTCCDFDHKSPVIASGSTDGLTYIYDVRTGDPISQYQFPTGITTVAFSPIHRELLVTCEDGSAYFADIISAKSIKQIRPSDYSQPFTTAKFCLDGRHILTTYLNECKIRLWDIYSRQCVNVYQSHESQARITINPGHYPSGPWIVGGTEDGKIYIWNLCDANILQTLDQNSCSVVSLDTHPGREMIASAVSENSPTIRIWKHHD